MAKLCAYKENNLDGPFMKIYLDHNLVVYLRNNSSSELSEKIDNHKKLGSDILYSPAHLEEIAVSQMRNNVEKETVDKDIDFLTALCGKNSIRPISREEVVIYTEYPRDCYERVISQYHKNDQAESMEKEFFIDVHKNSTSDPKEMNNYNPAELFCETLINKELLLRSLIKNNLISQQEALECLQSGSYKILHNRFCVLEHSFNYIANWLEMIGYYRESEDKSRSRLHDVSHIIYASYSDLFVSNDKKLIKKAAAIYSILEVQTKVMAMGEYLALE